MVGANPLVLVSLGDVSLDGTIDATGLDGADGFVWIRYLTSAAIAGSVSPDVGGGCADTVPM